MIRRTIAIRPLLALVLLTGACDRQPGGAKSPAVPSPMASAATSVSPQAATAMTAKAPPPRSVHYVDVTEAAGIHFRHENGAFGKKYLPETMGAGVAWLDYDGDGRLDLFLVNSRPSGYGSRQHCPVSERRQNLVGPYFRTADRSRYPAQQMGPEIQAAATSYATPIG